MSPRPPAAGAAAATALLLVAACGSAQDRAAAAPPAEEAPAGGPARAGAPKESLGPAEGDSLVRLHLLADTTRIAPGQELTLAARFDIEPGWHLYWKNPGESGLPTEVTFTAPPGFEVGEVTYPGPGRFDSPGDITSYGYHDLVLLSAVVRAPDELPAGAGERRGLPFAAEASWLACREVCVRGQGSAVLDLPPASAAEPARPAHEELFARHREALPRPLAELGDRARHTWEREERQTRLRLEVRGAERLEYFPPAGEDLALIGQASAPSQGGARLELSYKPGKPAAARGVLAVSAGGAVRYHTLDLQEQPR